MAQNDAVMNLGLDVGLRLALTAKRKWEMVEDADRIDAGRDMKNMRTVNRGQVLLAQQVVAAVMGAIVKAFVAGEAKPPRGADVTLGGSTGAFAVSAFDDPVVLGHMEPEMEHPVGCAPGNGSQRPQLSRKVGHHVEVIDILANECRIGLHINQSEVFAGAMGKHAFLPHLEFMGGVGMHGLL